MSGMTGGAAAVAVTVLFSLTGLYTGVRTVVGYSGIDRVHNAIHLLMSATMALMPWSAYALLPAPLVIAAFTAAALFYVALLLFRRADAIDPLQHHSSRGLLVYHALMMTGMVWMAIAMTPVGGGSGTGEHAQAMAGMSAMHGGDDDAMTGSEPWAIVVSVVCGVLFALAALVLLLRAVRIAVRAPTPAGRTGVAALDALVAVVMAAGMSAAFLLVMT